MGTESPESGVARVAQGSTGGALPAASAWPEIIKEASRTPLGIVALGFLLSGAVVFGLFLNSGDAYKLAAFGFFVVAAVVFVLALRTVHSQAAAPAQPAPTPAAAAAVAAPERPTSAVMRVDLADRTRAWSDMLLSVQHENGGLRTSVVDTGTPAQVWSTAQGLVAVLAVHRGRTLPAEAARNVRAAFEFIEARRNAGAIEGWGVWDDPPSPAPSTAVEAWVAVACAESLRAETLWKPEQAETMRTRIRRTLDHLVTLQDAGGGARGGWCPTTPVLADNTRTYPTVVALWALVEASRVGIADPAHTAAAERAISWLLHHWVEGAGWRENPNRPGTKAKYPGLTAHTLYVLSRAEADRPYLRRNQRLRAAQLAFLTDAVPKLLDREIADNEQMDSGDQSLKGTGTLIEGSTFLWYPWTLLALRALALDEELPADHRACAADAHKRLLARAGETDELVEGTWAVAETLHAFAAANAF